MCRWAAFHPPLRMKAPEQSWGRYEPEPLCALHRLGPRRHAQLPVRRDRLGLDGVTRHEQLPTDLLEGQMRWKELQHAQLGRRERVRPAAPCERRLLELAPDLIELVAKR